MDFQERFDNMTPPLQAAIRASQKHKEEMLLLYCIETNLDKVQEILEAAGVPNPKGCKKCYGRYRTGFKYPDARVVDGELIKGREVPVLCECVMKNLKKREGKLLIKWEKEDGETNPRPLGFASKAGVDQGKED